MATIEKIPGKTGVSYRITVSGGFDTAGKRIRHRMTYKPEPGMTPGRQKRLSSGQQRTLSAVLSRAMWRMTARPLQNMPPMCLI